MILTYWVVHAFNLEFFRNWMQLKISDDIVLLGYETVQNKAVLAAKWLKAEIDLTCDADSILY